MTSITIPETLTQQAAELNDTLIAIDVEMSKLTTQRSEVEVSLRRISNAILVLSGELPVVAPSTVSGRKPMSAEAKQKISEALKKSHLRRQFDITGSAPQPVLEEPVAVVEPIVPETASRPVRGAKTAK